MTSTSYPNALRFDYTADTIQNTTQTVISETKKKIQELIDIKEKTFSNTIVGIEEILRNFNLETTALTFLSDVSPIKEVRDASVQATVAIDAFSIEVSCREDLYKTVLGFVEANQQVVDGLKGEDLRLLNRILRDFKRNGLHLSEDKRSQVKQLKTKISELCTEFQKNLNEENQKWWFTREELKGLRDDFFESLPCENGKYAVSLKYPEIFPILKNCQVSSTRKAMEYNFSRRCIEQNTKLLEDIIDLRQKEAELLGYASHAEYILEIRMAKNPQTVFDFLTDLTQKLEQGAKKELEKLLELKKRECEKNNEPFDNQMNIYDWRYYDNLMLETEYNVDHHAIKSYFPLEHVTDALLDIYQTVLGLRFNQLKQKHVWHEDVLQYEVFDSETQAFMGHFYLDLHPRDGKYGHAAKFTLQKGCINHTTQQKQYAAAAMVCNFTKPTQAQPSLLDFDEVVTYFHEFGHVMHELCAETTYARFAGTLTERDFVEAPSQMLENWCYESEILSKLSGHYKDTSKKLPEELKQQLLKTRYVNESIKNRRQLHFGTFDMRVHTAKGKVDTQKEWLKCMTEVGMIPGQENTNGAAAFGHITGGYSAGYYGYLWSQVFSSDMFSLFKEKGALDKELGKRYREKILKRGGSLDADEFLTDFLGRKPSNEAFLKSILNN